MSTYKDRPPEKKKRDYIMRKGYSVTILTTAPDKSILVEAKCPSCQEKICYFSKGERKHHKCSLCGEEVYL
jgi:ribosomal protein S27E